MSDGWEPTGEIRIHVVTWHHPKHRPSFWRGGEYERHHLEQRWRRHPPHVDTEAYEYEWRPLTVHHSRKAYKK